MRYVFVLFFLLSFVVSASAQKIAVLPFYDRSNFRGPWKLKNEIPKYLIKYLAKKGYEVRGFSEAKKQVVAGRYKMSELQQERTLVAISKHLECDYIISGKIKKYSLIRKMAGSGKFGGYKSYTSGIATIISVFDAINGKILTSFTVETEKNDKGLRINLPGKLSPDESDFYKIEKEKFGSDVFTRSVAGQAMNEVCQKIEEKIEFYSKSVKQNNIVKKVPKIVFEAKILNVSDSIVYVNVGSDDTISIGDEFPVYSTGEPIIDPSSGDTLDFTDKNVGKVRILFIKASHVSSASIVLGKGIIKSGDRIRVSR